MVKILLNILIGIILIVIWLHFVNLPQIITTLGGASFIYLIPIFFCMFFSSSLRALRLKIFLTEVKKVKLKDLIFLNGVSMCLNFFIPIRAGEVAKGVYLNTHYDLNLGKSIIWVFIDRFVDFLVVLLSASLLLSFVPNRLPPNFVVTLTLIFLIVLTMSYLAIFKLRFFKKIISFLRLLLIDKNIKIYFDRFTDFILEAFSILDRHPKDLSLMVVITIAAYISDAAIWYFGFMALGFAQDYLKMYLVQLLSALIYLIPAAPGYIGSAEASGLLILSGIFGIPANLASAATVLFHIAAAIFIIIYGLFSIFILKIDLKLIFKRVFNRK